MYVKDNASVIVEGRGAYMVGDFNDIYPAIDQRLTVGDEKTCQPWHADMKRTMPDFDPQGY
jgi:hypothetical protein